MTGALSVRWALRAIHAVEAQPSGVNASNVRVTQRPTSTSGEPVLPDGQAARAPPLASGTPISSVKRNAPPIGSVPDVRSAVDASAATEGLSRFMAVHVSDVSDVFKRSRS